MAIEPAWIVRKKAGDSVGFLRPSIPRPLQNLSSKAPRPDDQNPTKLKCWMHGGDDRGKPE
jgi:hypothetical protein